MSRRKQTSNEEDKDISCKCGGHLIIINGAGVCSDCGVVLISEPYANPGEWCPHVLNDHAPICPQAGGKCREGCSHYLDGMTNIPLEDYLKTPAMERVQADYKERDGYYLKIGRLYAKTHKCADKTNLDIGEVHREQGR